MLSKKVNVNNGDTPKYAGEYFGAISHITPQIRKDINQPLTVIKNRSITEEKQRVSGRRQKEENIYFALCHRV
ncbi:MAG: hypothetical protein N2235_14605 [Fischerella sp.]|nr:hypothetical protein [Fischerella sp.]